MGCVGLVGDMLCVGSIGNGLCLSCLTCGFIPLFTPCIYKLNMQFTKAGGLGPPNRYTGPTAMAYQYSSLSSTQNNVGLSTGGHLPALQAPLYGCQL